MIPAMPRKRAKSKRPPKRDELEITIHPGRSLLAPGVLDDVHGVLRTILPQWCKRLRVRLDEWSRDWIDVAPRRGALERAVRKMIKPGETYEELVEELGPVTYERALGAVTLTGAYSGVLVVMLVDDWVFQADHLWGNFICVDAGREIVEGAPAVQWTQQACRAFCEAIDVAHGWVTTDGEYYSKNRVGEWRIVGIDPSRYLPGMYWTNIFGKPYVKLMGRERLLSTPDATTAAAGGHVLVRFGDDPWGWKSRGYRAAVARGLDHIGRKFFFDKNARTRKTVAPPFRFESDRIDLARGDDAPAGAGGELIVDYTSGKVYLKESRSRGKRRAGAALERESTNRKAVLSSTGGGDVGDRAAGSKRQGRSKRTTPARERR
jgi:hypothetical protein